MNAKRGSRPPDPGRYKGRRKRERKIIFRETSISLMGTVKINLVILA